MADTKKYREIICRLLEEYASIESPFWPNVKNQLLIDNAGDHYQLVRLGWDEQDSFVYYVTFHFDIKDGKILIQANNTDRNIVDELVALGINRQDIILAFQMPRTEMSEVSAG